jgi:hypothetical protein
MTSSCLPKFVEIPESQLTPLDLLAQYSTYNIDLWSSRSTHQASTLKWFSQLHHLLTTRHADSTCNISDWSHLTQPKPTLATRKLGKPCPRASQLPETHHQRTRRNRHPTTAYPYRISFLSTAQYRSEACFSFALSRLES